jgi:RND family efflux transporter MFP subunit
LLNEGAMKKNGIWSRALLPPVAWLVLVMLAGCGNQPAAMPPPKAPEVIVSQPVVREVTDYEDFPGHTEAVASVDVRARVSGYLDKVLFFNREGAEVQQGEVLFEIDPRTYAAELNRSEATLQQAQAHLKRLQREYDRAVLLVPSYAISKEDFDKTTGDRDEAEAAVHVAEAVRDLARLNIAFTRVTAPISGWISRRMVDVGNLVKADDTVLTTIVTTDPMYIYFDVDERTMLRVRRLIRAGKVLSSRESPMPVFAGLVDEVDEKGNPQFPHAGTIDFVDNRMDANQQTLRLRGIFPNPQRIFSPGMFARIRIPIGKPHTAILISEQALGTDQGQPFVYVVGDKDEVAYRPVKLGILQDGQRVVEEGLAEGERIVIKGVQRIQQGIKVEAKLEEMPNPGAAVTPPLVTRPEGSSGRGPSS